MENKINIAELLKDCPQGMELDCTINDDVKFIKICSSSKYPIILRTKNGYEITLTKYGQVHNMDDSKCVIFPKGKTTWEGFVPPCKFKDGDILISASGNPFIFKESHYNKICESYCGIRQNGDFEIESNHWTSNYNLRLATEEEKQKLFDAIKANGYKWNAETKTLEKLPRFKEIHFYKDSLGISNHLYESILKTHNTTISVIQNGWDTIYSYAISALDFSWLLNEGYKIFLHENGKCGELHEGVTELTDKELHKYHDIRKIWIGGGFEDFFYR